MVHSNDELKNEDVKDFDMVLDKSVVKKAIEASRRGASHRGHGNDNKVQWRGEVMWMTLRFFNFKATNDINTTDESFSSSIQMTK